MIKGNQTRGTNDQLDEETFDKMYGQECNKT